VQGPCLLFVPQEGDCTVYIKFLRLQQDFVSNGHLKSNHVMVRFCRWDRFVVPKRRVISPVKKSHTTEERIPTSHCRKILKDSPTLFQLALSCAVSWLAVKMCTVSAETCSSNNIDMPTVWVRTVGCAGVLLECGVYLEIRRSTFPSTSLPVHYSRHPTILSCGLPYYSNCSAPCSVHVGLPACSRNTHWHTKCALRSALRAAVQLLKGFTSAWFQASVAKYRGELRSSGSLRSQ